GTSLDLSAKVARGLEREMPRRRRKEDESHHVRAGVERDVERLARGQAADFDEQRHGFFEFTGPVARTDRKRHRLGGFYNVALCLSRPEPPYRPPWAGAGRRPPS